MNYAGFLVCVLICFAYFFEQEERGGRVSSFYISPLKSTKYLFPNRARKKKGKKEERIFIFLLLLHT
jgi:hypothetical protein